MKKLARLSVVVTALCGATILSGCQNTILPPCPSVRVDSTTSKLIKFRDGGAETPADVAYEAQIVGYGGQCENRDKGIDVTIDLDLDITAGPAADGKRAELYYFVAIPQHFPKPEGKQIFRMRPDVPKTPGSRERVREGGVRVFIPLPNDEPAAAYDIYVGFQLNDAQLRFNRAQQQAQQ